MDANLELKVVDRGKDGNGKRVLQFLNIEVIRINRLDNVLVRFLLILTAMAKRY